MKRGEAARRPCGSGGAQRPGHGGILDDEQPGDQPIAELEEQGELAVGRETGGLMVKLSSTRTTTRASPQEYRTRQKVIRSPSATK